MTAPPRRAERESAALSRLAVDRSQSTISRVQALLVAHARRDFRGCLCGWSELGRSHAGHQAEVLERAGLLAVVGRDA